MKHYRTHLFVLCALAVTLLTGAHDALHNALVDKRFEFTPRQATGDVVLVAIDSRSIEQIGVWPWPRRLHAEIIKKLDGAGASDIVFDVDFSAPSAAADDDAFLKALQGASGSVILPTFKQVTHNRNGESTLFVNRPLPKFIEDSWAATVNVVAGRDGIVRRYSYGETMDGTFYPSVAALLGGKYQPDEKSFIVDFSIQRESVPRYSYVDILNGDVSADLLKGKKIIIGGTAVELGDRFNVPNGIITGPMLQVLAAESILQDRALRTSTHLLTAAGVVVIALVMMMLWRRLSAGYRLMVLVGMAVAAEAMAIALQAIYPVALNTAAWHAAIAIYLAAIALDEIDIRGLLARIAERRFHRITMSLGDGLVCADRNGLITLWNPAAESIFGYQPDDIIGRPFDSLCCAEDGTTTGAPFSLLALSREALQAPAGQIMELTGKRRNGEIFPLEACFSGWPGTDGFQYGAVLRDISVRKREEGKIRYLAAYDSLTGLANRNTLRTYLDTRLGETASESGIALMIIGIDRFKEINDTLGHAWGDQVLWAVAEGLKGLVNGSGLVARVGGDEFAVVISGSDIENKAKDMSGRIFGAFGEIPLSVGGRRLRVRCSVGIAIYPDNCATVGELQANADLALHRAKSTGRGCTVFFDQAFRAELEARVVLEAELRRALERNEFVLFYQPQIHLGSGALAGAEALIRWQHPERGLVPPGEFIPVVNASSMSDQVARWVLQTACRQARLWEQMGRGIRIGVNLSPSQMQAGDLPATVAQVLEDTGLPPALLELEVTEDILLADDETARKIFRDIQRLGVHVAFDDFGTGYASLAYLKKFQLDRLKIDRSFVRDLLTDPNDAAIVDSTIRLGKQLGLSITAEGIENSATADMLARMGCDEGQGYHFSRPVPAHEFERVFFSTAKNHDTITMEPAITAA